MMIRILSIVFLLAAVLLVTMASVADQKNADVPRSVTDEALILSVLLDYQEPAFVQDGEYDGLAAYKSWGKLYHRIFEQAKSKTDTHKIGLKKYLLLGFVARSRLQAATSESLSTDLLPIFLKRPDETLAVLRDMPFLLNSTCYYLGNHFGFEDKNVEQKTDFLAAQKIRIENVLSPNQARLCAGIINDTKH